jgi:hypothetical protein
VILAAQKPEFVTALLILKSEESRNAPLGADLKGSSGDFARACGYADCSAPLQSQEHMGEKWL